MAWIRVMRPDEAEGELARYYEESRAWSRRRRQRWGLPANEAAGDVQALRRHGFDDRGILDIVLVAGMFNLTNRIVLGLGRDLHAGMRDDAERLGIAKWRRWA